MKRCCLIPARGGSKRLPRKNVVDFLGKPIIAYGIEAALETGLFERVVVSTDDAEIADVAKRFGAVVAVRPPALATDRAQVIQVIMGFVESEEATGREYDMLCVLQATSPLRNADDIRAVVGLIEPGVCGFSMAVTDYDLSPHQALINDGNGFLVAMWPELVTKRKQDVPAFLCDNGSTYAFDMAALKKEKAFYGSTLKGYRMSRERSVDIDVAADLEMAKLFARESLS